MNPNLDMADLLVGELAACGLRAVCIAPGSRSTPLTLAFHRHPQIEVFLHLDERSGSFFALGLALASERPVAIVCTSGTAAAEFHAAIIEARQAHVPLLVLTSDRPHELRHSGANQTVDQVKMYGDHVLWAVDMALPTPDEPHVARRNVRTMAARAYMIADGIIKGPVHLNFPFRKPLEPDPQSLPSVSPSTQPAVKQQRGRLRLDTDQLAPLLQLIDRHERGIFVCGPCSPGAEFPELLSALSRRCGYPIFADPLSGLRFGPHTSAAPIVGGYESFLAAGMPPWGAPQVVIRFGAVPTSKALNQYLTDSEPEQYIHIRANGVWADDSHLVNHFIQADELDLCRQLLAALEPRPTSTWQQAIMETEQATWQAIDDFQDRTFYDATAITHLMAAIPPHTRLFVGNSLPIRHLDQFAQPSPTPLQVFANRGASGIDGTTSTALGIAAHGDEQTVLVTGDVAFYHDLNGLLAVDQHGLSRLTIVLLNNNGGNIFRRLPIARIDPPFSSLFLTPHGLDFAAVARMYGLDFMRTKERDDFDAALTAAFKNATPEVIELRSDGERDHQVRQMLVESISKRLRS